MKRINKSPCTRKEYLNGLCTAIYGQVKVNYQWVASGGIEINGKSGLADKFRFYSAKNMAGYREQMVQLFFYTFKLEKDMVEFTINRKHISKEIAFNNALEYFKKFGIDDSLLDPKSDMIIDLVFEGLCEYVLRAIFDVDTDDININDYSNQDISDAFNTKLDSFVKYLLFHTALKDTVDLEKSPCYFNPLYFYADRYRSHKSVKENLNQCNFAVPFTIRSVFDLPNYDPPQIAIPFRTRKEPNENRMDKLVAGYLPIITERKRALGQHMMFDPSKWIVRSSFVHYPLFNAEFELGNPDITVYYLTRLTEETITTVYGNPDTHDELHSRILKKARQHIKDQNPQYNHIESDWCTHILKMIETTVRRVEALSRCPDFLSGKTPDDQCGQEILSIFDIPKAILDEMQDFQDASEKWDVLYIAIENAIHAFAMYLVPSFHVHTDGLLDIENDNTHLINTLLPFIRANSSENQRKNHIENNRTRLESEAFCQAISTLEKQRSAFNSIEKQDTAPVSNDDSKRNHFLFSYKRLPNVFKTVKSSLERYHALLLSDS